MKRINVLLYFILSSAIFAQTTLNFLSSNNQPERKAVIRYLFDAFELYNPDIKVNLIEFDENQSINDILYSYNNILPDIIMSDSRLLYRLADIDYINHILTDEIINELDKNDFYSGSLNSLKFNSSYSGVPYSAWLQVLWYRSDWFKKNSISKPDNIKDILYADEYFSKNSSGNYGIILGNKDEVYTEQCFLQFAGAFGLSIIDSGGTKYLESNKLVEILNYYNKLTDYLPFGEHNWRSRDYFFQNRAAMLIYSTHLMDDLAIQTIAEDSLSSLNFKELTGGVYTSELLRNTEMITSITGNKKASFGSVSGIGIIKKDDIKVIEAQKKLIQFLYRPDVYITWLHMSPGGMLPVKKSILENDDFFRDSAGVFKRFGRDKIISLTEGIEYLTLLNTEALSVNDSYRENGLQHLIFNWINNNRDVDLYSWVK